MRCLVPILTNKVITDYLIDIVFQYLFSTLRHLKVLLSLSCYIAVGL